MERKSKILLLGPLPPPYMGPSIATEIILKSKIKEELKLYHLNTNTHHTLSTLGKWSLKSAFENIEKYFQMIFLILRTWPDLVVIPISQTTPGFIKDSFYIIISRLFFRKTLLQLRGSNFLNWLNSSLIMTQLYVSFILDISQGMIVLGEKIRYQFSKYFNENEIFVIPNGADYDISPSLKENHNKPKLLYISNLQPSKGIEDVLQALALLKRNHDLEFEVDILGGWREEIVRKRYLNFAESKNLPVNFHSTVVGKEKMSFLSDADIFVFPPRDPEGHPWVIIEAMAAGLPIITTDQGAITESVINGVNGFIVEGENPEQIAEKVLLLIRNARLRIQMGKESRKLYEEKFTEKRMVQHMLTCFDKVLNPYNVKLWFDGMVKKYGDNYILKDKYFIRRLQNVHLIIDTLTNISDVLDIGCGSGEITASVYERLHGDVVGIDISDRMIEHCKGKYHGKNLYFGVGDMLDLSFKSEQFDLVLSLSIIEWVEGYEKGIAEAARVLRPGGQWIVSLPNWASPFRKMELIKRLFSGQSYVKYQKNHVSISEFKNIAESYGLRTSKTIFHVLPFYELSLPEKLQQSLGMMCMMSMRKS